jgi:small subunit ribosomal protein S8
MLSTDPIADMLSRMRNALLTNKVQLSVPHSTIKERLARELERSGFIAEVKVEGEAIAKQLSIRLRDENEPNRMSVIERISKPGRRMYAKADAIPRVMNGRGIMIISTSQGLMTDREARSARLGGELICKVY